MMAHFVFRLDIITDGGSPNRRVSQYDAPLVVKGNAKVATANAFPSSVSQQNIAGLWVGAKQIATPHILRSLAECQLNAVCEVSAWTAVLKCL